ncbi:MAG TPA: trypsin-like peptidase domain-containing protein, partial [Gemmatimonadota bacterium]|nr:trypsin-like peptidase domain-containing protein [Gemmatimonadota bacterium]
MERRRTLPLLVAAALLFAGGIGLGALLRHGEAGGSAAGAAAGPEAAAADRAGSASEEGASAGEEGSFAAAATPRDARAAEPPDSVPPGDARVTPTVSATRAVRPSVVSVNVVSTESNAQGPFSLFFQGQRRVRGLGSGFAIDDRGYILTNAHVVENANQIVVVDASGHRYTARLVGSDALTDVAVLKIPSGRVPPAPLGTSSDLMVGEPAIAIGNPFGFYLSNPEATVTTGVISGVNRDYRGNGNREVLYADMIQT